MIVFQTLQTLMPYSALVGFKLKRAQSENSTGGKVSREWGYQMTNTAQTGQGISALKGWSADKTPFVLLIYGIPLNLQMF